MPPHSPLGLLDRFVHGPAPCAGLVQPALPLQGLTVLAVEDSRYSSDALRLMCQRSGARLRRVDCLQTAYAHLHVYCPDVILIDIGLPDGRGDLLIRDIANQRPEGPVIIAISGDPDTRTLAMQAGAQGFLDICPTAPTATPPPRPIRQSCPIRWHCRMIWNMRRLW